MPPELPLDMRQKWHYDHERRLVTATQRVTNDNVEDILEAVCDMSVSGHICIYSGVHGIDGGLLQVDDEDFYLTDMELAQEGTGDLFDPNIRVFKMPFQETPPLELAAHVADPLIIVILAWCFSKGYM